MVDPNVALALVIIIFKFCDFFWLIAIEIISILVGREEAERTTSSTARSNIESNLDIDL